MIDLDREYVLTCDHCLITARTRNLDTLEGWIRLSDGFWLHRKMLNVATVQIFNNRAFCSIKCLSDWLTDKGIGRVLHDLVAAEERQEELEAADKAKRL